MATKRSRGTRCRNARVAFPLGEFLQRLHQAIGGSGPEKSGDGNSVRPYGRDLPDLTLGAEAFRTEYLWAHILKKFDDGRKDESKRNVALQKFREAEQHCAAQPSRWASFWSVRDEKYPLLKGPLSPEAVALTASAKIRALLGPFSWDACVAGFGFGPGATTSLPRSRSDLWHKFRDLPGASSHCVPLVEAYLQAEAPLWRGALMDEYGATYTIVDSNTVTTVPKDYRGDRPIAIEPQWNMFFQKGIGSFIRRRLRKVGIDLNDQKPNQLAARKGSEDGSIATIDLSSASDTVSLWVAEKLLPTDLMYALEQCRSQYGVLTSEDGSQERVLYRKLSSMGCGFTFEVEALIFWALASTTVQALSGQYKLKEDQVLVYGDDIVVPSWAYDHLIQVLTVFGFIPNVEKSYGRGPFRESCGFHGFAGLDVTPFYIRRNVRNLSDLFLLHNNLQRWGNRALGYRDDRLRALLEWVRSHAPHEWRKPRICDGYGDGAFIGSFDEVTPRRARRQREGWVVEVLAPKVRDFGGPLYKGSHFQDIPRLLRSLWLSEGAKSSDIGAQDIPMIPSIHVGYKVQTCRVFQWHDLHPYLNLCEEFYEQDL